MSMTHEFELSRNPFIFPLSELPVFYLLVFELADPALFVPGAFYLHLALVTRLWKSD